MSQDHYEHFLEQIKEISGEDLHAVSRKYNIPIDVLESVHGSAKGTIISDHYPYKSKMSRKNYDKRKLILQIELAKMHQWIKRTEQRVVMLFEGRDAAGKGGTINRFTEHLNPRRARVVALEKPSEKELGQWYFQRYIDHLPTTGEIVFFDRSWYNRAGVEKVMGFCSHQEYSEFIEQVPAFEKMLIDSGIILFKFWFSVSRQE